MNARFLSKVRVGLTVTSLGLCGALALSTNTGCGSNASTGGAGGTVGCGDTVSFTDGRASGPMKGWSWVALGKLDSISDPTCDTDSHPITNDNACTTTTNWSTHDSLCISGSIPALPAGTLTQQQYDDNWGLQVGVNSDEPPADKGGNTMGQTYKFITFSVDGTPSTGLRAELHIKGDDAKATYCATFKSGDKVTLTAFNTKCWGDSTTVTLTDDKIPNIDKVGIQVSSTAGKDITVDKLCLHSVAFSN